MGLWLFPAISAVTIYAIFTLVRRSRRAPFPPGPRQDPLIGNIRQIGSNDLKVLFEQWGREYGESFQRNDFDLTHDHELSLGPIVYASAFGKPLIVLNSFSVAQDLLQKRGNIYSSRPRLITFSEM